MGYFAELDSDEIVIRVISVSNDVLGEPEITFPSTEPVGQDFISTVLGLPGEWRQTSFNANFREFFAAPGYRYDSERDQFVPPEWTLENGEWVAPPEPDPIV